MYLPSMAPTSKHKERSFTFTLSEEELARLHAIARAEGRPAANWLRHMINTAAANKRHMEPTANPTTATPSPTPKKRRTTK